MIKKVLIACFTCATTLTGLAQNWIFSEPTRLDGSVNEMESEESIPVFSQDSSRLYFVRVLHKSNKGGLNDQDIWYSERQTDGSYSECELLKSLNNKFNNAVVGVGDKGNALYLLNAYEGKKDTVKGIAKATRSGNGWSKPSAIEIPDLNIDGTFYGFHVNESEDAILMSYAGPNSLGEEDIYVSVLENGVWSSPIHLGSNVNSSGFDISPFLSSNSDTLFFSSNGHGGLGGADIFYSVKQGGWSEWSTPINLGEKINSDKFDAYFTHSDSKAYWSSNRDGERSDIYTSDMSLPPPIELAIEGTDVSVNGGKDGTADLTVSGGVSPYDYKWSNGSISEDVSGLLPGDYSVVVTDAVNQTKTISVTITEPAIVLDPVEVADYENHQFKHLFKYNKNKLKVNRGEFKSFIKKLESQLKDGREQVTILINSSASQVPTRSFGSNDELAKVRAENMKYDLLSHFEKKSDFVGKVNIVVSSHKVQGPAYDDDARNKSKYEPFQYVQLITE